MVHIILHYRKAAKTVLYQNLACGNADIVLFKSPGFVGFK